MKQTLLIVAVAILVAGCTDKATPTSTEIPTRQGYYGGEFSAAQLFGDVESLTIKEYLCSGTPDTPKKEELNRWHEYSFNSRGDVVTHSELLGDGTLLSTDHYDYDKSGLLLKHSDLNPDGELFASTTYTYSPRNHLTKKQLWEAWYGTDLWIVTEYEYDNNGRLAKERQFEKEKGVPVSDHDISHTTYTYDSKGRIVQEDNHNSNTFLTFTYKYTYEGNKEIVTYYIGESGKPSTAELSDKTIITRNEAGLVTSEYIYDSNDQLLASCKFTYDDHGNLTSKVGQGVDKEFLHTYDSQGNITSTLVISYGEVHSIISYDIRYRN